jgi:hypothetical protein
MNRSEVSPKWNKCRIYVGDQLDRWNELNEVLRVQTRAEYANILLERKAEHVFSFYSYEVVKINEISSNNSDNDVFWVFFVKKSFLLPHNSVLIFILYGKRQ